MKKQAKDAMEFEETPMHKSHKVNVSYQERTPLSEYRKAKEEHRKEIKKIRLTIKQSKADIKRHKLLRKQARITYKLTKGSK